MGNKLTQLWNYITNTTPSSDEDNNNQSFEEHQNNLNNMGPLEKKELTVNLDSQHFEKIKAINRQID